MNVDSNKKEFNSLTFFIRIDVHCVICARSLCVHCTFTVRSLYVHCAFAAFAHVHVSSRASPSQSSRSSPFLRSLPHPPSFLILPHSTPPSHRMRRPQHFPLTTVERQMFAPLWPDCEPTLLPPAPPTLILKAVAQPGAERTTKLMLRCSVRDRSQY